jgi:hypothetical protein
MMEKLCTNKNHSYKHNEQINKQNIDNSECFGVTFVKNLSRNDFIIIFDDCVVCIDRVKSNIDFPLQVVIFFLLNSRLFFNK